MPAIAHVQRRDAVFYWRWRVPKVLSKLAGCSYLVLSLGTKDQAVARKLAAILDSEAMAMVEVAEGGGYADHRLSGAQIKGMFRNVAMGHLAKLDRVAEFDRLQSGFSVEDSKRTDITMGHVFRLLAIHGEKLEIDEVTAAKLIADGLTRKEVEQASLALSGLRRNNMVRAHQGKLEALLSAVGAVPSPINLGIAQTTRHRAISAALFDTRRRWDGQDEDDSALLHALTRDEASVLPPPVTTPDRRHVSPPLDLAHAAEQPSRPVTPTSPPKNKTIKPELDDRVMIHVEKLLSGRMKNVDDKKGKRQVRSEGAFFAKYLLEVHRVSGLAALRQEHLAGFVELLQKEAYIHHGKSEHDEGRSIAELRAIWKTKPTEQIGIDKPTADRWTQHLSQVFKTARAGGVAIDRDLSFDGLVVSKARPKRGRNARPTMQVEQSRALFRQPPFLGCQAWNAICEPGNFIFHCAVYFATMLINYGGERREEICGALVDDVITDNGKIPYIFLTDNEFRRLKNPQSERIIALHPELIRLGFLLYVATIKALGYKLLFPDLYSPTTQSPLGDRYHDQLRPVLDLAGITDKGTGSHSSRRGFGNNLKQKRVTSEERAEMLGHGGDSETTERYCDPYDVQILYDLVLKLPVVTDHLHPSPITLLPWVASKQVAPFSQPSRTKEAKLKRKNASR